MERYKDLNGNSGVVGFDLAPASITVYFEDGSEYLYTSTSAGTSNLGEMQNLARKGSGLNTFINQHVKKGYAQKLR